MRIWIHCALLAFSCLFCYQMRPLPPESTVQQKAQRLVDQVYGPGHARVTVTVRRGHGERTVNTTDLGREGFVVGSQRKSERYDKAPEKGSAKSNYEQQVTSEKLELPREITTRHEEDWVERTSVAVVLDRPISPELAPLLEAGLGLDRGHGDQVSVMQSLR